MTKENKPTGSVKSERIYYWDNAKLVLMFLVVLGHFVLPILNKSNMAKMVYDCIYLFHMPVFIFISGVFSKKYLSGHNKIMKPFGFLLLYVLFFVLLSLLKTALKGKLFVRNPLSTDSTQWYLFSLFFWYLALPFAARFKPVFSLPALMLISLCAGTLNDVGDAFVLSRTVVFFPFFLLGFHFKADIENRVNPWIRLVSACFLAGLFLCIVLFNEEYSKYAKIVVGNASYHTIGLSNMKGIIVRLIWYFASGLSGAAFLCIIPRRRLSISFIGERTLAIYILHRLIREVFSTGKLYSFMGTGSLLFLNCLVVSVAVYFLCSLKPFSIFFNTVFNLNIDRFTIGEESSRN